MSEVNVEKEPEVRQMQKGARLRAESEAKQTHVSFSNDKADSFLLKLIIFTRLLVSDHQSTALSLSSFTKLHKATHPLIVGVNSKPVHKLLRRSIATMSHPRPLVSNGVIDAC